jgi:hypothetical protein
MNTTLNLQAKEEIRGRSLRQWDETTSTWYCTDCLADLPDTKWTQLWHICKHDVRSP